MLRRETWRTSPCAGLRYWWPRCWKPGCGCGLCTCRLGRRRRRGPAETGMTAGCGSRLRRRWMGSRCLGETRRSRNWRARRLPAASTGAHSSPTVSVKPETTTCRRPTGTAWTTGAASARPDLGMRVRDTRFRGNSRNLVPGRALSVSGEL